jgi:hypothetical protein
MSVFVFRVATPFRQQHFEGTLLPSALTMEAVCSFETLERTNKSTWRYNCEGQQGHRSHQFKTTESKSFEKASQCEI